MRPVRALPDLAVTSNFTSFLTVRYGDGAGDYSTVFQSSFLRGTLRVPMAIVAHTHDLDGVRRTASAIERGLVLRTERAVGLTRTL